MYACAGDTYLERHIVYIISIEAVNIQRISWHICGVRVGGELSAYRFRSFAILRSRTRASPNASRVSRSPFHVKSLRPNLRHKNVWSPETATTPICKTESVWYSPARAAITYSHPYITTRTVHV